MAQLESVIQSTTISMLRALYPDLVINLSLNGISLSGLSAQQRAQLIRECKQQGMETGIPDLLIYLPNGKILNLEFKRSTGKQSPDQLLIEHKLTVLGHNYHLVRSYEHVFELIADSTTTEFRKWQYGAFNNSPAFKAFPQVEHLFHLSA